MSLPYKESLENLPSIQQQTYKSLIRKQLKQRNKIIIVLDDDPTGTQTMYNVPVLTSWEKDTLALEFKHLTPLFYILTNSRSLTVENANLFNAEIGKNIKAVADEYDREYIVISRSDSTLRGHYPNEIIALAKGLEITNYHTAIIPAFFEGGRFTINDVHYVKEGANLIPAAETQFAKDKTFGFKQSNLKKWIIEKTHGQIEDDSIHSFSILEIRTQAITQLSDRLKSLPVKSTIIVNAADNQDLEKFALAYLSSGVDILFRTAASFVRALFGREERPLLKSEELVNTNNLSHGGLIIVGSYVPKTTVQIQPLLQNKKIHKIEITVSEVLAEKISEAPIVAEVERLLLKGEDVLIYTSRDLHAGNNENESLAIGNIVSDFLTKIVKRIAVAPKFVVAKGGITSSETATKALLIKKALVLGQVLPGIPVWKAGEESKFPGMPYIIFPGNVGDDNALENLYQIINEI